MLLDYFWRMCGQWVVFRVDLVVSSSWARWIYDDEYETICDYIDLNGAQKKPVEEMNEDHRKLISFNYGLALLVDTPPGLAFNPSVEIPQWK